MAGSLNEPETMSTSVEPSAHHQSGEGNSDNHDAVQTKLHPNGALHMNEAVELPASTESALLHGESSTDPKHRASRHATSDHGLDSSSDIPTPPQITLEGFDDSSDLPTPPQMTFEGLDDSSDIPTPPRLSFEGLDESSETPTPRCASPVDGPGPTQTQQAPTLPTIISEDSMHPMVTQLPGEIMQKLGSMEDTLLDMKQSLASMSQELASLREESAVTKEKNFMLMEELFSRRPVASSKVAGKSVPQPQTGQARFKRVASQDMPGCSERPPAKKRLLKKPVRRFARPKKSS